MHGGHLGEKKNEKKRSCAFFEKHLSLSLGTYGLSPSIGYHPCPLLPGKTSFFESIYSCLGKKKSKRLRILSSSIAKVVSKASYIHIHTHNPPQSIQFSKEATAAERKKKKEEKGIKRREEEKDLQKEGYLPCKESSRHHHLYLHSPLHSR